MQYWKRGVQGGAWIFFEDHELGMAQRVESDAHARRWFVRAITQAVREADPYGLRTPAGTPAKPGEV